MSRIFILIVLFFGLVVSCRVSAFYLFPLRIADGEKVSFATAVFVTPKISGATERFEVRYGNFWHSVPLSITTTADKQISFGDRVIIAGTVRYSLLSNKKTVMAISFPQIEAEKKGFLPIFAKIRQEITRFCENTFSQPYSSLLAGMVLGVSNSLPSSITRSFRITGVSHVVAASGMNVTLVAGFFMSFLSHILKRRWALVISVLGIVGYMVLAGLGPSILRAGVMGMLVFGAQLFGRQYTILYSLFLTTGLLLFWDPLLLLDVSFQLSVCATAGILFLKPLIPIKGFLLDDVGTTLAAQIATLPVLLSTFGSYGVLSILVNALVLWTVPLITILGGIGITLGFVFQPLGQVFLWMVFPLLLYFQSIIDYFANFSFVWQVTNWSFFLTLGYYFILTGLVLFMRKQR